MELSYDKLWQGFWGDIQRFGPVHRHLAEDLVRTVASLDVRSVLDVGCGSGDNLAALDACNQYELAGVDVSQEALNLAGSRVPSAKVYRADIQNDVLPQKFDLVISVQVVEHLLDDIAAFKNIASMSRHYVFISTISGSMRRSEIAIGHVRNYSEVELRRKLEAAGMEVLRIGRWGFPFYSPLYRSLVELFPGGPPAGPMGPFSRTLAGVLYYIYKLNVTNRGDVLSALARPKR
jgi:2-polyprenyl-3-methyl-5-hydroxy-6-metoxy-1,4-benzoquinol methylase